MDKKYLTGGLIAIVALTLGLLVGYGSVPRALGGSTSDNWSVGGNLTVTGTSAPTGNATLSGTLAVTGASTLTGAVSSATSFVDGGTVLSLATTSTRYLFSGSQVCTVRVINATSTTNQANMMVVWPSATSTAASCLTSNGGTARVHVVNTYPTSTVQFSVDGEITRGVGLVRTPATSTMILNPGESAEVVFRRVTAAQMFIHWIKGEKVMGLEAQ